MFDVKKINMKDSVEIKSKLEVLEKIEESKPHVKDVGIHESVGEWKNFFVKNT